MLTWLAFSRCLATPVPTRVQPGADHRDGAAQAAQRAAMGCGVYAVCHAADDAQSRIAQVFGKFFGVIVALGGRITTANDGERTVIQQVKASLDVQQQWRVSDVEQGLGIIAVAESDNVVLLVFQPDQRGGEQFIGDAFADLGGDFSFDGRF